MERDGEGYGGSRQAELKKSFKFAVRPLLTACSRQEFVKVFSNFTTAEQERLYELFLQVITSLHRSIEDEFEAICLETQVGTALDTVEQQIEEQRFDPSNETNIMDFAREISTIKEKEIENMTNVLKRVEEHNRAMETCIELCQNKTEEHSAAKDALQGDEGHVHATEACIDLCKTQILTLSAATNRLQQVYEHIHAVEACMELFKNKVLDLPPTTDGLQELRSGILDNLASYNDLHKR